MSYSTSTKKNCNPFGSSYIKKQGNDAIIVIKDQTSKKKSEYRAINHSRKPYFVLQIDGGLIPKNVSKSCDFLLLDCLSNTATLIELKGKNIGEAIDQISATLNFPSFQVNLIGFNQIHAKIVLSSTPSVLPAKKLNTLRKLLRQKHNNGTVVHANSPLIENF